MADVEKLYNSGLFVDNPFGKLAAQAAVEAASEQDDGPDQGDGIDIAGDTPGQYGGVNLLEQLHSPVEEYLEAQRNRATSKSHDPEGANSMVLS